MESYLALPEGKQQDVEPNVSPDASGLLDTTVPAEAQEQTQHFEQTGEASPSEQQEAALQQGHEEKPMTSDRLSATGGEEHHFEQTVDALSSKQQEAASQQAEQGPLIPEPLSATGGEEHSFAQDLQQSPCESAEQLAPFESLRPAVAEDASGTHIEQHVQAAFSQLVSSRLESLESEVSFLSSELARCHQLMSQTSTNNEAALQEKLETVHSEVRTSTGYLDHKLEEGMRQLKEQVRLSKTVINSWCRGAATKIADCQDAVSKIDQDVFLNVVMGRIGEEKADREADVQLIKRELRELRSACALRHHLKTTANMWSPGRRAARNTSPRNRPLCRRQGWHASTRSLSSPLIPNPAASASVDFACTEQQQQQQQQTAQSDLHSRLSAQELVHQMFENLSGADIAKQGSNDQLATVDLLD